MKNINGLLFTRNPQHLNFFKFLLSLVLIINGSLDANAQINQIQNPSFESNPLPSPPSSGPDYTTNSFNGNPALTNWTSSIIDLHHSTHYNMLSPEGVYHVDLNETGSVTQSGISLIAGTPYQLRFSTSTHAKLSANSTATATVSIQNNTSTVLTNAINNVKVNGTNYPDSWTNLTFSFTPNVSGTFELIFEATGTNPAAQYGGVLIDNIILEEDFPDCDNICFWKVNGNNILGTNRNRFGTTSNDHINIISNNSNRGIITNNGRFGWNIMNPLTTFHVGSGNVRFDDLSGTNSAIVEVDNLGTLKRKANGNANQFLNGTGGWSNISTINFWSKNTANNLFLTPTGSMYVGVNNPNPQANVDIINTQCDNKPAIKILDDYLTTSCNIGSNHGNFMEFYTLGNTIPRYIVTNSGWLGINRIPAYTIDVPGPIRVGTVLYPSDQRYKNRISSISSANEIIDRLNPKEYYFDTKKYPTWNFDSAKQFGFLAQELKEVLPEVVKKDKDGFYAVDYISLIPILTQAIKEQQVQIVELKKAMLDLASANTQTPTSSQSVDFNALEEVMLSQNVPNPFTADTKINYAIPHTYKTAKLGVYDLNGHELKLLNLTTKTGEVVIQGRNLKPGMYIYSLIIDGISVASKRMTLTSN